MKELLKKFGKAAWELPQNVVGFIVMKVTGATSIGIYNTAIVFSWKVGSGLSLGKYIFVPFDAWCDDKYHNNYVRHEYGHTLQSRKLGWLYLPVVGIPSLIWAGCFKKYREKKNISYYSFYTEKWADRLGGVTRL